MLEIQKTTLRKAINLLNSIKVEYAILADGEKHGSLEVAPKRASTKKESYSKKYGRGVVLNYVRPYIQNLNVGDVARIPAGDFDLRAVSAISATFAHGLFGVGGHTIRRDKNNNVVEIMRLEV
jgi:hypothetical protein